MKYLLHNLHVHVSFWFVSLFQLVGSDKWYFIWRYKKKLKYLICNRHSYRKKKKFLFIKSFQKMKIALVCQYDIGIWWLLDIWKSFIFFFTPKLHYPLERLGLVILITPRNYITIFLYIQRWDTSWWILCLV